MDSKVSNVKKANRTTHTKQKQHSTRGEVEQIIDASKDAIRIINKDFTVRRINRAFAEMIGVNKHDVIRKKCWEVFPSPLCNTSECRVRRILAGEKTIQVEIERKKKDGSAIICVVTTSPLLAGNGRVDGIVEQFRDVSERKLLESNLEDEKNKYQSLFNDVPISLWEMDYSETKQLIDSLRSKGIVNFHEYFDNNPSEFLQIDNSAKFVRVNKAFLNMFEISNFAETTEIDFSPGSPGYVGIKDDIARLAEGAIKFTKEEQIKTKTGKIGYVQTTFIIAPGHENTWSRVFVSLSDITDRVQAENELKKYQEHLQELIDKGTSRLEKINKSLVKEIQSREAAEKKAQKLYENEGILRQELERQLSERAEYTRALVHELKTPLTPLIASSDHMMQNAGDGPFALYAKNIYTGALNLSRRVDELLDLAKGESGMLRLQPESVNLNELISDIVGYMSIEASNNKQIIAAHLPKEDSIVWADDNRLRQVLINLLDNALKFTRTGGKVDLRLAKRADDFLIQITDNGCGMDEEQRKLIFEPYARAVYKKPYSGLGLGLVLCKMFVELHGGKIWVSSEKDNGSTFSFTLPLNSNSEQSGAENF